ncbi:MAG: hypothetical protein MUE85_20045 [Microscillaceae bacterium]|jgi:hypothetical protein|nr:hypothetical protein [Microscillaceae bacterium]
MKFIFLKIFILIFSLFPFVLLAQDSGFVREPSTTRYIKDIYQYVQDKINRNQYYINESRVNTTNLPWLELSKFQSTQQYFYSFVGDDTPVLRLVTIVAKVNDKNYYAEYLFDNDGKLIFCYEKQNDSATYPYREFRAYFENGLCINLLLDKEIIEAKNTSPYRTRLEVFQSTGKFYAQKFFADMKEVKNED